MTSTTDLVALLPNRQQFGFKGKNAAYRAAALGEIPAIKVGGKWLVPLQAIEAMYVELGRQAAGRSRRSKIKFQQTAQPFPVPPECLE